MTELLRSYSRIRSSNLDEVREAATPMVGSHRLQAYPHRISELSVFNAVSLGDIALCYSRHGVPVRIQHDPSSSFVLVRFSLSGLLTVHGATSEMRFGQGAAMVFDPDLAYDISKDSGAEALLLRVQRSAIHDELQRMLGRAPTRRLQFHPSLDMTTPLARSWWGTLQTLCADLDGPRGVIHPALHQPVERVVITQLLTTVLHSASDELAGTDARTPESVEPRIIRRADQIISEHCREPLTVSDIAEAVGCSVRSLQHGFRRHLDSTPSERLRLARLAGVHADLLASDPTRVTVSQVLSDWGFGHSGRVAQYYRIAYGESPSQTLRR